MIWKLQPRYRIIYGQTGTVRNYGTWLWDDLLSLIQDHAQHNEIYAIDRVEQV